MNHTLYHTPNKFETVFGWIYLAVQQFFLPFLLALAVLWLRLPVSDLWLNFIFFTINFTVVVGAFHSYLYKCLEQLMRSLVTCLLTCLAGFLLYWVASFLVNLIIVILVPDFTNANNAYIQTMADDRYWIMFVGSVILVPIVEETLYRGVIFGTVHRHSRLLAYAVSTALFAAIHVVGYIGTEGFGLTDFIVSTVQYLPAGVCLAWAYEKTGTIFTPVLIHTAINLLGMMAMR